METIQDIKKMMKINPESISREIQKSIMLQQKRMKKRGAVIGLSGGIDSAVVTALCTDVLGKKNVRAILLPDSESSRTHLYDARDFAERLGVHWEIFNITPLLRDLHIKKYTFTGRIPFLNQIKSFLYPRAYRYYQKISGETPFAAQFKELGEKPYHSYIKKGRSILYTKHRLRMVILYFYAEQEDQMVIGCINKTEHKIGLFVRYGIDHLADIMPIRSLYKTQVRQLAEYLRIPDKIIRKKPSPDLIPGLDDHTMIGMPYEQIDLILLSREQGLTAEKISMLTGIELKKVKCVLDLVYSSRLLREFQ